jgi:hypothetical protein
MLNSRGAYPVKFLPVAYNITNSYDSNFDKSQSLTKFAEV